MATINENHLKFVQRLKECGEPVLQPKFGKPMKRILGYVKTQDPSKDAGAIFQDKNGKFGLFGDMGALHIDGIEWDELGLCDSRCWYEWTSPDTYKHNVQKKCPYCGQLICHNDENLDELSHEARKNVEKFESVKDFIPEIIIDGTNIINRRVYAKVLVYVSTCLNCDIGVVNLENPFLVMLSLEYQIKKAGLRPKSKILGSCFEYLCEKCASDDVAVVECALCGLKIKFSQIKESFGDDDYLCTSCYETIPAEKWYDKKIELESKHMYDNG